MFTQLPKLTESLSQNHLNFLQAFTKSCRKTIIETVKNSQSGHPGGSLSTLDYLAVLYTFILSQTGEKIVISNGHISPAVYSVLAEMGYADKEAIINTFRKFGSIYEGHVTRYVDGIFYGTGPLGVGVSAATGFAMAEKLKKSSAKTFATVGDGEMQEGQVYEMLQFCGHHKLNNIILFVDYNRVQLTASLKEIQDINVKEILKSANWKTIEIDGHDHQAIWKALEEAHKETSCPVAIIGETIMGKGVEFMENEGRNLIPKWHGAPPSIEDADKAIETLQLSEEEKTLIENFKKFIKWHPEKNIFQKSLSEVKINSGNPIVYGKDDLTDCRSAYGKTLADLAKNNPQILGLSADLKSSVMTKFLYETTPNQYIECGICEQHMVSMSGGLSLTEYIPFCSTFGAFMSSRAKDQARVNDINHCNVKMVATHCGLSVGEDGPTHQAIDDIGSFLGMYETMIVEPSDPNQTDKIIRYIASHYGNFYVRMGRHKIPTLTKESGELIYDENYKYEYGKCDIVREGSSITIACLGAITCEALKARENLQKTHPEISVEIISVSSPKQFDDTLLNSIRKTKKIITVEDHNIHSGFGSQLAKTLLTENIKVDSFEMLGTTHYELSGTPQSLYKNAGIDAEGIEKACLKHYDLQ
ncbi:MAG: transketolase [Candidatus Gracilibacteria bacterium]|nr:transketolase [Candidatus Gracilibacteria bacterium]